METMLDEMIERDRPELAKRAWDFIEQADVKAGLERLSTTAMRLLLNTAIQAGNLKEILIVIRYLHGRDRYQWSSRLVTQLETALGTMSSEVDTWNDSLTEQQHDYIDVKRTTAFLGYLMQLHTFVEATSRRTGKNPERRRG